MTEELLRAAELLDASPNYRVLRRLTNRDQYATCQDPAAVKVGIILDTETTGLDSAKDEVIELGILKFEFDPATGYVFRVLDQFSSFRDPGMPIPPEITKLTGITDDMVAGQAIDAEAVNAFIEPAVVVIAHKAEFDRPFAERLWPAFERKAWACSFSQVDWRDQGFEGSGLPYLLMGCGLFHDAHRAIDDCRALLEVLAAALPLAPRPALKVLLDTARKTTFRLAAVNSPFQTKDLLKARGYRWNDGSDGTEKAWWIDLEEEQIEAEVAFLYTEIYRERRQLPLKKLTAFERFSERGVKCAPDLVWKPVPIDEEATA